MATSTIIGIHDNVVRVPRSTDNGLWSALAAKVTDQAPSGSLVVLDLVAVVDRTSIEARPAA
jgi:hypothetical protein